MTVEALEEGSDARLVEPRGRRALGGGVAPGGRGGKGCWWWWCPKSIFEGAVKRERTTYIKSDTLPLLRPTAKRRLRLILRSSCARGFAPLDLLSLSQIMSLHRDCRVSTVEVPIGESEVRDRCGDCASRLIRLEATSTKSVDPSSEKEKVDESSDEGGGGGGNLRKYDKVQTFIRMDEAISSSTLARCL